MQSLIILTPSLLPAWPCGPSNPAQLQRRCLTRSRIQPEPYTSSPSQPRHSLIAHPDLIFAPQSSPLEAAVKPEPAFDAEPCGAKSTVPPKRSSIKATIALAYTPIYATDRPPHPSHRAEACSLWRERSLRRRRSRKSRRITTAARRRHCSRVTHYASTACLLAPHAHPQASTPSRSKLGSWCHRGQASPRAAKRRRSRRAQTPHQ